MMKLYTRTPDPTLTGQGLSWPKRKFLTSHRSRSQEQAGGSGRQNPYGKVPVLVDGDGVIYESAIINEYLDEKFPEVRSATPPAARQGENLGRLLQHPTPPGSFRSAKPRPEKAQERMAEHLRISTGIWPAIDISSAISSPWPTLHLFRFIPAASATASHRRIPNVKRWGEELIARPEVVPHSVRTNPKGWRGMLGYRFRSLMLLSILTYITGG